MVVSELRIANQKSFRTLQTFFWKTGVNLLVGKNGAGKTTVLEVLGMKGDGKAHRSLSYCGATEPPTVAMTFVLSNAEFREYLARSPILSLPWPREITQIPGIVGGESDVEIASAFVKWFLALEEYKIDIAWNPGNILGVSFIVELFPLSRLYEPASTGPFYDRCFLLDCTNLAAVGCQIEVNVSIERLHSWVKELFDAQYKFLSLTAPLRPSGLDVSGKGVELRSDASNLATCLNSYLSNNPVAYSTKFIELVRYVLPEVRWVSAPTESAAAEIQIWRHSPETERDDLAHSLSDAGSGTGQVLAILYTIATARQPRVIAFDEIQSHLHPSAARRLMQVLHRNPQHQYVVSTHSPVVISSSTPSSISVLSTTDFETRVKTIDSKCLSGLRDCLREIGAQLSDVFGAEKVLWVEGPTESACFPEIVNVLLESSPGFIVLPVKATGDFESKKTAEWAYEIHKRVTEVSCSGALTPPKVSFLFDREGRSAREVEDFIRKSRGAAKFLTKRLYENYLLHWPSVAAYFSHLVNGFGLDCEESALQEWLLNNSEAPKYWRPLPTIRLDEAGWEENVHGARLLADLLSEFSEGKLEYKKTEHSYELTRWILNNASDSLRGLADELDAVFD